MHVRKYLEISKIYLKTQLIWRADVIFNMVFTITKIIFAYVLWGTIFEGKATVSGFTFDTMLSYYLVSSFLSQIELSGSISKEMSTMIRNGTFSKYMVMPISIQRYFMAREAGSIFFYFGFDLIAVFIWILIFPIRFVLTANHVMILFAVCLILLGLLFMAQLNYFLGILTLKFQDIGTFLMIKDNLMAFITGTTIPLVLLPEGIITGMRIFPFYYVTYLPTMLLIGRCEKEAVPGIIVLSVWCLFFVAINKLTYGKMRVKYDGVGI